ncbi:MAG: exodeoxyribonuclease VII large subunit [Spirochaetes bacterium]|nr:MAG: exodeoxyribonuclease VII large subunit [Spirochaetota bacterium]
MEKKYSVSEITYIIRSMLEKEFPDVLIEGEISNFRPSSTGHYYFTLKDSEALISVVMFKSRLSGLSFKPADGMLVTARGSVSVYPKRGSYQLICESLKKAGEGSLLALIEERKRKLATEGLFNADRKKRIPLFPSHVAVVTSPTGAAIKDILRVLKRRNTSMQLNILPAPVQGADAAAVISEQIKRANMYRLGDVIIVTRGGGSLEDLLPFYTEEVVRAIADSSIPVISAVGHEIDVTLTDLAADLRAPTPSAAAEMVSASRDEIIQRVSVSQRRMIDALSMRIEKAHLVLNRFSRENLERNFSLIVKNYLLRLDESREVLSRSVKDLVKSAEHRVELVSNKLNANSPLTILKKGYAAVTLKRTGKILKDARNARIDDKINVKLYRGGLDAEIKEIIRDENF